MFGTKLDAVGFAADTMRVDNFRYTEFVKWNGSTLQPIWNEVLSRELYNHTLDVPGTSTWEAKDDFEDVNCVSLASEALLNEMATKLRSAFGVGIKSNQEQDKTRGQRRGTRRGDWVLQEKK